MIFTRLILILYLIMVITSCNYQTNYPPNLKGMLLYIEDLDGIGGSGSGSFSDIVAHNPATAETFYLTKDMYYYASPSYSLETNKLYFESKRENFKPYLALGNPSNLYELDIRTQKIKLINSKIFRNKFSISQVFTIGSPRINKNGDELLFNIGLGEWKAKDDKLIIYNLNTQKATILYDSLFIFCDFDFTSNDSLIILRNRLTAELKKKTDYLGLLNRKDLHVKTIVKYENTRIKLGSVKNNRIVYTTEDFNTIGKEKHIYIYDILESKKEKIISVNDLGFDEIKHPIFRDGNSIYFIGSNESKKDDTLDEDVFLLNLATKELEQITFTHNIKDDLRYYGE